MTDTTSLILQLDRPQKTLERLTILLLLLLLGTVGSEEQPKVEQLFAKLGLQSLPSELTLPRGPTTLEDLVAMVAEMLNNPNSSWFMQAHLFYGTPEEGTGFANTPVDPAYVLEQTKLPEKGLAIATLRSAIPVEVLTVEALSQGLIEPLNTWVMGVLTQLKVSNPDLAAETLANWTQVLQQLYAQTGGNFVISLAEQATYTAVTNPDGRISLTSAPGGKSQKLLLISTNGMQLIITADGQIIFMQENADVIGVSLGGLIQTNNSSPLDLLAEN